MNELPKKSYKQLFFSPTDERIVEKRRRKAFEEVVYLLPAESAGEALRELSYYDRMVADAAYTLMRRGVPTIYAKHIMEVLSGNEALTLRPDRKQEVEESLLRLAETHTESRPDTGVGIAWRTEAGMATPIFPIYRKNTGFAYDPATLPPDYVRAERSGRLIRAPQNLFAASGLPTSMENLAIAHYLYTRLALRQRIRFTDLCTAVDIQFPKGTYYIERKEDTIRQKARRVLASFRESGMKIPRMLVDLEAKNNVYGRT